MPGVVLRVLHALSQIVTPAPGGGYQPSSFVDGKTDTVACIAVHVGAGIWTQPLINFRTNELNLSIHCLLSRIGLIQDTKQALCLRHRDSSDWAAQIFFSIA